MHEISYRMPIEEDVTEIVDLLNENVSFGLANFENVSKYIQEEKAMVSIFKGKVIGYICCSEVHSLKDEVLGHDDILKITKKILGEKVNELMVIRTFCVKEEFRNKGIGTELRKSLLQFFPSETPFITIGWMGPEGWKSQGIAIKQGFKIIMIKEKFWLEDSLKNGYGCEYCGSFCQCSAVIAVKI